MMRENNYAVIMAGGVGSRFWPMSVEDLPKQFLDVLGIGKTLIQLTYERLCNVVPDENIYIVTNEHYVELAKTQLDRKSTRLNSSHVRISYAVFCLKKKKKKRNEKNKTKQK